MKYMKKLIIKMLFAERGKVMMFTKLRMELEADSLDYRQSSNLQGVIYENISSAYVDQLHVQQLHPYSQCLVREDERPVWYIKTMDEEARKEIIEVLQKESFQSFTIKNGTKVVIKNKQIETVDSAEWMNEFYDIKGERYLYFEIQTPTAFKQNGSYVIMPDLRLIYQSLMNKYSAVSEQMQMLDTETLEQLTANSEIVRYRLHSTYFPLEGISVPGFRGELTIRFKGADTLARYARLLMHLGEFSGIGIKTAMGMGAIKVKEWRRKNG